MDFTPNQKYSLLSKMGYTGPMDSSQMENFIASNPGAAAKMGKFQRALTRGFQTGGVVDPKNRPYSGLGSPGQVIPPAPPSITPTTSTSDQTIDSITTPEIPLPTFTTPLVQKFQERAGITPELIAQEKAKVDTTKSALDAAQAKMDQWAAFAAHPGYPIVQKEFNEAQAAYDEANKTYQSLTDPKTLLQPFQADLAFAATTDPSTLLRKQSVQTAGAASIPQGTGQIGDAPQVAASLATAETVPIPDDIDTVTMDADKVTPEISSAIESLEAITGEVSKEGTVRGQLESLMQDFEGGGTPPWASGAMRQAMGIMQQRGLGSSSIAGQAVVQSAMESALSIATQDAATVAQFEMANLNREQETVIFKTQQKISGLLSDSSAENAARQFNAASENQVNQFVANLQQTAAQFNAAQVNAISQFNAGQSNAMAQFNAELQSQREQFNANNALVIAQANGNWRQQTSLANAAAQNEANRIYAQQVNGLTAASLDNYWQEQRDKMSFAFQESENEKTRAANLMIAQLQANNNVALQKMEQSSQNKAAIGSLAATALFGTGTSGGFGGILGSIF